MKVSEYLHEDELRFISRRGLNTDEFKVSAITFDETFKMTDARSISFDESDELIKSWIDLNLVTYHLYSLKSSSEVDLSEFDILVTKSIQVGIVVTLYEIKLEVNDEWYSVELNIEVSNDKVRLSSISFDRLRLTSKLVYRFNPKFDHLLVPVNDALRDILHSPVSKEPLSLNRYIALNLI